MSVLIFMGHLRKVKLVEKLLLINLLSSLIEMVRAKTLTPPTLHGKCKLNKWKKIFVLCLQIHQIKKWKNNSINFQMAHNFWWIKIDFSHQKFYFRIIRAQPKINQYNKWSSIQSTSVTLTFDLNYIKILLLVAEVPNLKVFQRDWSPKLRKFHQIQK